MGRRSEHEAREADRRARTRRLIELGGLVQKSGLVELTDDDRNTLYGGLLLLAGLLRSDETGSVLPRLERQGRRAFRLDREAGEANGPSSRPIR
jgi:hypothetical protein